MKAAAAAGRQRAAPGKAAHESFLAHDHFFYLKLSLLLCIVSIAAYVLTGPVGHLVAGSPGDFEEPRELGVSLAPTALRDVSTDRACGILALALRLEVCRERRLGGELEHFDPYLLGESPDNQLREVANRRHAVPDRISRAGTASRNVSGFRTKKGWARSCCAAWSNIGWELRRTRPPTRISVAPTRISDRTDKNHGRTDEDQDRTDER